MRFLLRISLCYLHPSKMDTNDQENIGIYTFYSSFESAHLVIKHVFVGVDKD